MISPAVRSEDYVDAHERLTKLRLKKGQQLEIVRVLFECCSQVRSPISLLKAWLTVAC